MKQEITITAELRDSRGKNEARRLRAGGKIPAVVYGARQQSVAVAVSPKDLNRILRSKSGHNTIFNVDIQGRENTAVMIVDWQNDPVRENLLHADLKRIDLTQRIAVKVPVHTTGEPKGVKQEDGLLELVTREIEIECLPEEIPEEFVIDVVELMLGQSRRASDLVMTGSMQLLSPPDAVIAHVIALRAVAEVKPVEVAAEAAPAAAAAEPEVIKKGKKEEEGEAEVKKKK
ncbi:MAG: 50S ribosomal protein L25 [Acidobacteria bacterium]|nr:50S ribosomal protein L25 [Acidobacteriota bacterium]